jgi:hypothetical protein
MKIQRMRAWYKPEKAMYHVLEMDLEGLGKITLLQYSLKDTKGEPIEVIKKVVPLTDCTVMNCTSRLTRSGLLIYEGDLVRYGVNFSSHGKIFWDFTKLTWMIDDGKFNIPLCDIDPLYIEIEGTVFSKTTTTFER